MTGNSDGGNAWKLLEDQRFWMKALFILLLIVSLFATLVGFYEFIGSSDSGSGYGWLFWNYSRREWTNLIFATIASVAVVGLMAVSVELASRKSASILWRTLCLCCYLFFATWSVTFGFAFFWKITNAKSKELSLIQEKLYSISTQIRQVQTRADQAVERVRNIAINAKEASDDEAKNGGRCTNNRNSRPNKGSLSMALENFSKLLAKRYKEFKQGFFEEDGFERPDRSWNESIHFESRRLQARIDALNSRKAESPVDGDKRALEELKRARLVSDDDRQEIYRNEIEKFVVELKDSLLRIQNGFISEFRIRLENDAQAVGENERNRDHCYAKDVYDGTLAVARELGSLDFTIAVEWSHVEGAGATRHAFDHFTKWGAQEIGSAILAAKSSLLGASSRALTFGANETDTSSNAEVDTARGGKISPPRVSLEPGDKIALFMAIAIDLGILFMTFARVNAVPQKTESKHKDLAREERLLEMLLPLDERFKESLLYSKGGVHYFAIPETGPRTPPEASKQIIAARKIMRFLESVGRARMIEDSGILSGARGLTARVGPFRFWRSRSAEIERALLDRGVPLGAPGTLRIYELDAEVMNDFDTATDRSRETGKDGDWREFVWDRSQRQEVRPTLPTIEPDLGSKRRRS